MKIFLYTIIVSIVTYIIISNIHQYKYIVNLYKSDIITNEPYIKYDSIPVIVNSFGNDDDFLLLNKYVDDNFYNIDSIQIINKYEN